VESERQYLSAKKFEEEFPLITFAAFPHPHPCNGLFRGCSPGYSFTFSLSPVRHTPFLRCLYTIYLHPRSYFLSIWLSLVCFLIFFCQSPLPPSPESVFHLIVFCIFPIWFSFYSLPPSVHMYIAAGFPHSFLFYC
jgi:hypothetical protein